MNKNKSWLDRLAQVHKEDLKRVIKAVKGEQSGRGAQSPFLLYAREVVDLLRGKNRYVKCLKVKDSHTICALPLSEVNCDGCMFYQKNVTTKESSCVV